VGLSVGRHLLARAIPFALDHGLDLLLLDGTVPEERSLLKREAYPDLRVLRDALALLRKFNREEEIALLYFGGMRTGTDVAKILGLNCNCAVFGTAMGLAMGGKPENGEMRFRESESPAELEAMATRWIKATSQETAIIARCTGKTNIHNLEPEDMRTITLATSSALNLPLASGRKRRERF
jgi:glutamate synthase (NADPH/NADH) large chain